MEYDMRPRVLLVDDNPHFLEAIKRMLRREPYELLTALNAAAALELLAGRPCDVLVTDLMMPGIGGSALLRYTCDLYPCLVSIMLTGHPRLDAAVDAINAGRVFRFLTKPCSAVELGLAVRDALAEAERRKTTVVAVRAEDQRRISLRGLEEQHPGISSQPTPETGRYHVRADGPTASDVLRELQEGEGTNEGSGPE